MAAHIVKHPKSDCWFLADGFRKYSLKTKAKREAEALLRQYRDGKFGLVPVPTVGKHFEAWIKTKVPPLVRHSLVRDYRQCFNRYILPSFGTCPW